MAVAPAMEQLLAEQGYQMSDLLGTGSFGAVYKIIGNGGPVNTVFADSVRALVLPWLLRAVLLLRHPHVNA